MDRTGILAVVAGGAVALLGVGAGALAARDDSGEPPQTATVTQTAVATQLETATVTVATTVQLTITETITGLADPIEPGTTLPPSTG